MANYIVYLGGLQIAEISGTEYAYEVYAKTLELAELINESVDLIDAETGEIIAYNESEN